MRHSPGIAEALIQVGPRLKRLRTQHGVTLTALAEATGISKSTLSRLESGQRNPSLELLLPLATHYRLPLDELVAAPAVGDPRIFPRPRKRADMIVVPLTHLPGPQQAYKMVLPRTRRSPALVTHEGYEWLYVLSGTLRLIVAERDVTLSCGQAAEFDTRHPHWFGTTGDGPVEMISLLSAHGQKIHLTVHPADNSSSAGR